MQYIFMALPLLHQMGVTLGVGASTFALIFYIQATQDGNVDATERRFLRTVFTVLRIGMMLVTAVLLFYASFYHLQGLPIFQDPTFLMESTLVAVILLNALLTTFGMMPPWLGPSLAGGTWYALFLLQTLPIGDQTYAMMSVYYVLFVAVFYALYTIAKQYFSKPLPLQPTLAPLFASEPAVAAETKSISDNTSGPALKE